MFLNVIMIKYFLVVNSIISLKKSVPTLSSVKSSLWKAIQALSRVALLFYLMNIKEKRTANRKKAVPAHHWNVVEFVEQIRRWRTLLDQDKSIEIHRKSQWWWYQKAKKYSRKTECVWALLKTWRKSFQIYWWRKYSQIFSVFTWQFAKSLIPP